MSRAAVAGAAGDDQSITNRAYVEIRAALVSCRLKPGSRLKIAQLQRDLGVSQAAVREGLSRMVAEGLVTIERNSGFRAAPVFAEGYRELADACLMIELPLLRSSLRNGDLEWEGALLSAYHVASRALTHVGADAPSMVDYVRHRENFHRTLFSRCDNPWLLWSWSMLYTQQLRYRHTFRQLASYERRLHDDYQRFLEAVLAHDVELAVALWCENHEKVSAFIESTLHPAGQDDPCLLDAAVGPDPGRSVPR